MKYKFLLAFLFFTHAQAFAEDFLFSLPVLAPRWNGRPYVALDPRDKSLPPEQKTGRILQRATNVCTFLEMPAGNFRKRRGTNVQTVPFLHDGPLAVVEFSQGRPRARLVSYSNKEQLEYIKTLSCIGEN